MKRSVLLMIIVFGMSGCDNAKQVAIQSVQTHSIEAPITLLISPGYKVKVGGERVPISGSEDCLVGDRDVVNLGRAAAEETRSCIVIKPTTKTVSVLIGFPKGAIREKWGVVRSGDKALLQRPDGSYVEYAN